MHAVIAQQTGGPEVLEYTSTELPEPGPGQLRFRVAAAGVNFIDTYQRQGIYPMSFPWTPGAEASGVVDAVGEGVLGFSVGDRIATAEGAACYAEYALVDADKALAVPATLDLETAAALPLQGMTAHYLVTSSYLTGEETTALVHAGAGGVGLLLIQFLKSRGARVVTTVSTPEKAELARGAGADLVIGYPDFSTQARQFTDGRGVDVVYDGVGRDTFDGSLASLRIRGSLVLFGAASGPVPPVDPQRLNSSGSLFLTRPTLAHHLLDAPERRWRAGDVFEAAVSGALSVRVGARYPLSRAAEAQRDLAARRTTGKVLLLPDAD